MKHAWVFVLMMVGLLFLAVVRAETPSMDERTQAECLALQFEDYPVDTVFEGEPAPVDFGSWPEAYTFRTRIRDAVAQGPNAAGRYTVASWGCGTLCQASAVIDAVTGEIAEFGMVTHYGLEHRLDSRLVILNYAALEIEPDVVAPGTDAVFLALDEGGVTEICRVPLGARE